MELDKGFEALAQRLQEAATALSHDDIRRRVREALQSTHNKPGEYAYPVDIFGDDESGDVVYDSHHGMKRAPYSLGTVNGKPTGCVECGCNESSRKCALAESVTPRTVYDTPADDDDHYTAMAEALKSDGTYMDLPAYERFIGKDERDKADAGDFAGKGKSFPILKPEDVGAAVHAMGRAGSNNLGLSGLKARIIAIAKRKGWTSHLPKSWQDRGDQAKEAAAVEITGDIVPLKEGAVGQDGTALLKIITPGWGSSGYYPAEVLDRDGRKVFPKGTKNFWNHQTEAEEAARPEGDLRDLASVLTEDAHYEKSGPDGEGLYAKAKVFEQFKQPIDDLAKHIGMSIRASGRAKEGKAPDGRTGPIIQELTRGVSVDYVTTPGAGGKILQLFEAARAVKTNEKGGADDMDATEFKKLQEAQAALAAENRKLRERFALSDAADECRKYFTSVRVGEAVAERVTRRILERSVPLTEAGELDKDKLAKLIEAETKDECAYVEKLAPTGRPFALGSPTVDPKVADKQFAEAYGHTIDELATLFIGEGEPRKAMREAFKNGRAA